MDADHLPYPAGSLLSQVAGGCQLHVSDVPVDVAATAPL